MCLLIICRVTCSFFVEKEQWPCQLPLAPKVNEIETGTCMLWLCAYSLCCAICGMTRGHGCGVTCVVCTAHGHMISGKKMKPRDLVGILNKLLLGEVDVLPNYVSWASLASEDSSLVL